MEFQAHFIKLQANLYKRRQTTFQEVYTSSGMKNLVVIHYAFTNLAQAMSEDKSAVTNLTMEKSTLTEKVVLYNNRLSSKESDNNAL